MYKGLKTANMCNMLCVIVKSKENAILFVYKCLFWGRYMDFTYTLLCSIDKLVIRPSLN